MPSASSPARTIYQVNELAELLREIVEGSLPRVWVQGEISNLSRPASGHWYFTLKDARAQLRCAMFRQHNFHVRPLPRDGDSVLVRGQVSVYTARGDLQLICEHLEPAGEGALLRAFEELKKKLAAEGLFDEHLKRPIPAVPRGIGLITSGTGAALHDVRTTLERRFPLGTVYLLPVPVQGVEAAPAIVRALDALPARAPVDVIILARGGGSLEDLWSFNDERVARAIRACTVPVVTGVGHEIDTTIADFAADLRAATPTAAAELVSPDADEWRQRIADAQAELGNGIERRLEKQRETLQVKAGRLALLHPGRRMSDATQRLDELAERLHHAGGATLRRTQEFLRLSGERLLRCAPQASIELKRDRLAQLQQRLQERLMARTADMQARHRHLHELLRSLNPRAVLERGYAIALAADGRVLTDAASVAAGDAITVQLARGTLETSVTGKK
ncbi:MAG TPA: exodeoxyribonuclease VII large subunit [Nevskiaceae bacterium]|nr:exodeoxyribonuclease VII large subunit [Nevskiaceae bacterium]